MHGMTLLGGGCRHYGVWREGLDDGLLLMQFRMHVCVGVLEFSVDVEGC